MSIKLLVILFIIKNTGASKFKIWWRTGVGLGVTSISYSHYVLMEYIHPYDVLKRHHVEFLINLGTFLEIFLLVVDKSLPNLTKDAYFS